MSWWSRTIPCFVSMVLVASLSALAADDAKTDKPGEKVAKPAVVAPSPDKIAELIEQLDSDKFAERQAASDELNKIGAPAIEALGKAAGGDSLEATVRSINILKKFLDSSDEATRKEAKGALEKVAKSDRPTAARRAQDALKAIEAKQNSAKRVFGGPGGIQIRMALGGARQVSISTVNGVKTIKATEGERKIKIVDDPKQGIKMEVTTKKNGKQSTEKYEAKNADELKKKHPKAYEIYQKYAKQGGNVVMQVQAFGGRVQARAKPRRVNGIDTAARILPAWTAHLKRMATDDAIKQASKESNEKFKAQVTEARNQLADLEKRLQQAIDKAEKEADKNEEPSKPKDEGSAEKKQKKQAGP